MRIVFKVEGGATFGLGHVTRSIALAKTLEEMGMDVAGFACNEDAAVKARFRAAGIPTERVRVADNVHLQEALDGTSVDLLIVDQPTDVSETSRVLRQEKAGVFVAALDPPILDLNAFDVIVALFHHGSPPHPPVGGAGYFEGLEYAILREEFLAPHLHQQSLRERVGELLVSFGGTDPQRLTLKVLRAVQEERTHGMKMHIVIGPGFMFKEEIQAAAASAATDINLHYSPNEMGGLMARCDLGIVGGGTTLMEMCCVGCPPIMIAQNEAEMRFGFHLHERGAAHYLCPASEVTEEKIRAALGRLMTDQVMRQRLARQGRALIDGRGGWRTAELILREFARGRSVA